MNKKQRTFEYENLEDAVKALDELNKNRQQDEEELVLYMLSFLNLNTSQRKPVNKDQLDS